VIIGFTPATSRTDGSPQGAGISLDATSQPDFNGANTLLGNFRKTLFYVFAGCHVQTESEKTRLGSPFKN
jgi:hypothetical protein